ncbi:MAG: LD-carboxypeptidase [Spirochaetia bacterium]
METGAKVAIVSPSWGGPARYPMCTSAAWRNSVRILRYLDNDVIRANPKLYMGFSDSTCITTYLNQLGMVSFNGPSVMAGFSQLSALGDSYRRYLAEYLFNGSPGIELPYFDFYCEGYPEWGDPENTGRTNPFHPAGRRRCLQGTQPARGRLFGGCLEVLEMMKATDFWPSSDFWDGR